MFGQTQIGEMINYFYYDMNQDNYEELVVLIRPYIATEYQYIYSYIDNEIECIYSMEDNYTFIDGGIVLDKAFFIEEILDENEQITDATYRITDAGGEQYYDKSTYENLYNECQKNIIYDYDAVSNMYIPLTEIIQLPTSTLPNGHNAATESFSNIESSSATEYILPTSNSAFLTVEDLAGLTAEECRIARNELYARHGRIFTDETLKSHFESCSWYRGTVTAEEFDDSVLNEYEIANRDLIVQYEQEQGFR